MYKNTEKEHSIATARKVGLIRTRFTRKRNKHRLGL